MNAIVVGVDGSEQSLQAAQWAVSEAGRKALSLRIVHVVPPWMYEMSREEREHFSTSFLRTNPDRLLAQALDQAHRYTPDVDITARLVPGHVTAGLLEQAKSAAMLVVGNRGTGEITSLALGSTALQAVSHTSVPVVVVQKVSLSLTREVVVGVDGSRSCLAAIEFAFQEASLRKSRLRAVHAWTRPTPDRPDMIPLLYDLDETQAAECRLLSESLSGWAERYPDVEVIQETVHDRPVHALAAASGRADLIVLGARGLGGFSGLLLGSVSHALLHRAQSPVAIVPPDAPH